MSAYGFVDMLGRISVFVGIVLCACACMMPRGWRSAPGVVLIVLGLTVAVASIMHAPDGRTWIQVLLVHTVMGY